MATTTNYSWTTPDDTDLVKDGAAAIRTLGSSIDTTTKNLNPQTTTGAIAFRSATTNVNTSLPIGTAGQILAVNSGATAPEWVAAPSTGGMTSIASGTLSGASVSITSIPATFNELWLYIDGFDPANDDVACRVTFNSVDSGSKYQEWFAATADITGGGNANFISLIRFSDNTVVTGSGILKLYNYNTTNSTKLGALWSVGVDKTTTTTLLGKTNAFTFNEPSSAISSIQIKTDAGNFDAGSYNLYGVK
jgi:hypothetical protein